MAPSDEQATTRDGPCSSLFLFPKYILFRNVQPGKGSHAWSNGAPISQICMGWKSIFLFVIMERKKRRKCPGTYRHGSSKHAVSMAACRGNGRHHREILPRSSRGVAHQAAAEAWRDLHVEVGGSFHRESGKGTSHSRCILGASAKLARKVSGGPKVPPSSGINTKGYVCTQGRKKTESHRRNVSRVFHRDTVFR